MSCLGRDLQGPLFLALHRTTLRIPPSTYFGLYKSYCSISKPVLGIIWLIKTGSAQNLSLTSPFPLFGAVNRGDVENVPGAVVRQCLAAGQLPELSRYRRQGAVQVEVCPSQEYLFMAVNSERKIPHEQAL